MEDLKTPKGHFEINWLYWLLSNCSGKEIGSWKKIFGWKSLALGRWSFSKGENRRQGKVGGVENPGIRGDVFYGLPQDFTVKSYRAVVHRASRLTNDIFSKWKIGQNHCHSVISHFFLKMGRKWKYLVRLKYGFYKKSLQKDAILTSTTGTLLWWKKCSTGQNCIFLKWLLIKSIF